MELTQAGAFALDGEIARLLPRGGRTLNHESARPPELTREGEKWFLVFHLGEISRRMPLDNLSEEDWTVLKQYYSDIDFSEVAQFGLQVLEQIEDQKVQRVFVGLLSALNPRQVAILFHLYRCAQEQNSNALVEFASNDLLVTLGYKHSGDKTFPSVIRTQAAKDLWDMHRVEIMFRDPSSTPEQTVYLIRSLLTIDAVIIDNKVRSYGRDHDLERSAYETLELADRYRVALNFFQTIRVGSDYLLLPKSLNLSGKDSLQPSRNYRMKVLTIVLSLISKDDDWCDGRSILSVPLTDIEKELELGTTNPSRNRLIVRKALQQLQEESLLTSEEVVEKMGKKILKVTFLLRVNPQKIARVRHLSPEG